MVLKLSNWPKRWLGVAAVVVLIAATVAGLELTNTTHFFHKPTLASQTISKSGGQSDKSISTNNGANKGTATDTNGQAGSTTPSQWITAASGNIIVKQPAANATIHNGSVLSGSAKVGQVQYRLIDDKLGVISEGPLNVDNGNFSGIMHFQPSANTGRLDVFSYSSDNTEIDEVWIAVGLSQ